MFKLAICIPTYNRANTLPMLMDSILDQIDSNGLIQICISDNASEDNTEEIINEYKIKFPYISYHRNDKNLGPDRNFLKCVEIANSSFCWLMGSDDKLEPNALSNVLNFLEQFPSVSGLSVDMNSYEFNLTSIRSREVISQNLKFKNVFNITEDLPTIFSLFGDYIGFLSGQVINRISWNQVIAETADISEYYNVLVHLYVIGVMIKKNPRWGFISVPCIGARSGNDSFLTEGLTKRTLIDIEGPEFIANKIFGRNTYVYKKWMSKVVSQVIFWGIVRCKKGKAGNLFYLFKMCFKKYKQFPVFWCKVVPVFIMPNFLLSLTEVIVRWLKKAAKDKQDFVVIPRSDLEITSFE